MVLRRTWWPVWLAVLVAILPGCGSGNGSPSPDADRAAAEKATLRAADFPSGWSSRPHEPVPGEEELRRDIARCLGISPPSEAATAEVRSPDFTQGLATVSSIITFVKSESDARTHADALTSERFARCAEPGYAKQIHEVAPEGNTVTDVEMAKLDFPPHGDRSAADRVTAMAHIGEINVPINIDVVRVFKDRAELELTVVAPGTAFPADFAARLAGAVVGRL